MTAPLPAAAGQRDASSGLSTCPQASLWLKLSTKISCSADLLLSRGASNAPCAFVWSAMVERPRSLHPHTSEASTTQAVVSISGPHAW